MPEIFIKNMGHETVVNLAGQVKALPGEDDPYESNH